MWSTRGEVLSDGRMLKVAIDRESAPVSYSEVLRRWQADAGFRSFFMALLAEAPFSAFRWETPPITRASAHRAFEFVLLDSPGLAREPDVDAFAQHCGATMATDGVVSFPNLGNDAVLVVPCPRGKPSAYAHLAAFIRQAPVPQAHALWRLVGKQMEQNLGPAPIWLSTAGAGVAWLHVRLDKRPKYYGFAPYRNAISAGPNED